MFADRLFHVGLHAPPTTGPHRNHVRTVIDILRGASMLTSSHYVSDRRERDLMEQVVRG
jgi:hypothetical protein